MERVKVKLLNENAVMPTYGSEGAAGFDLYATEDVIIEPGDTVKVPTGLAIELPPGYEMQIRPRSGVTLKTKLRVQLGTVDADYRGEVGVIVDNVCHNCGEDGVFVYPPDNLSGGVDKELEYKVFGTYCVRKGDRIAQAVIQRLPSVDLVKVDTLGDTERGSAGFGSTGVHG